MSLGTSRDRRRSRALELFGSQTGDWQLTEVQIEIQADCCASSNPGVDLLVTETSYAWQLNICENGHDIVVTGAGAGAQELQRTIAVLKPMTLAWARSERLQNAFPDMDGALLGRTVTDAEGSFAAEEAEMADANSEQLESWNVMTSSLRGVP